MSETVGEKYGVEVQDDSGGWFTDFIDWTEDKTGLDVPDGIQNWIETAENNTLIESFQEVVGTPVNNVWNIVEAFQEAEDFNEFASVSWDKWVHDSKNMLVHSIGPEGLGGEFIGVLPEGVRERGNQAFEGLETAYREGIGENITGAITALQYQALNENLFSLDGWGEAWNIGQEVAEHRSPGQAFVLSVALLGEIIDDRSAGEMGAAGTQERENYRDRMILEYLSEGYEEKYGGSVWFDVTSGSLDAFFRIFIGPEEIAAQGIMKSRHLVRAARLSNYAESSGGFTKLADDVGTLADESSIEARRIIDERGLRLTDDIDETVGPVNRNPLAVDEETANILAGRLREKYFPKHGQGDLISGEMAKAFLGVDGYTAGVGSLKDVMMFFMGRPGSLRAIAAANPNRARYLAHVMKITGEPKMVATSGRIGGNADEFITANIQQAKTDQILEEIIDVNTDLSMASFASIDEAIRPTLRKNFQDKVRHSAWFRPDGGSRFGRTIQLFRDMKPQHHMWAGDANSGDQIARLMKEAKIDATEVSRFRGEWAVSNVDERVLMATRMQQEIAGRVLREKVPKERWMRKTGGTEKEYEDMIRMVQEDFAASHTAARGILENSRSYGAGSEITYADDLNGHQVVQQLPLTPSQLKSSFFVFDLKAYEKYLTRTLASNLRKGGRTRTGAAMQGERLLPVNKRVALKSGAGRAKVADASNFALGGVMEIWRPAVLLRPAWALRVVGDEQLRMFSYLGALGEKGGVWDLLTKNRRSYREGTFNWYAAEAIETGTRRDVVKRLNRLAFRRGARAGVAGTLFGGFYGGVGATAISLLRNKTNMWRWTRRMTDDVVQTLPRSGQESMNIRGVDVAAPFGTRSDSLSGIEWRNANSSQHQVGYALSGRRRSSKDTVSGEYTDATIKGAPKFSSNSSDDYLTNWERVVNDQFNRNQVGRIVFDDVKYPTQQSKHDALVDWMTNSKDGQRYVNAAGIEPNQIANVAATQGDVAMRLIDPTTAAPIRAMLANGERVSGSTLRNYGSRVNRDLDELSHGIHMQEVKKADGARGSLEGGLERVREVTDTLYERIAGLTTDELSRNPLFFRVYRRSMERRIGALQDELGTNINIPSSTLNQMENAARADALQEVRYLMYDLAESSRFSDMMRNVFPFFNAWQEVLTRWAGLSIENPLFAARMKDTFLMNPDVDFGSRGAFTTVKDDDGNRYWQIRLPEFAKGLLEHGFFSSIGDMDTIRIRASSINMITQGLPGFGPLVSIPVGGMIKHDPSLEEYLDFMFPYGVPDNWDDAMSPSWVNKLRQGISPDVPGLGYISLFPEQAYNAILTTRIARMNNGEIERIDFSDKEEVSIFLEQIETDARNMSLLRSVAASISPASLGFHTPYQHYIDMYREIRKNYPKTAEADQVFIEHLLRNGHEDMFFAFAIRASRSTIGVPPNVEAQAKAEEFSDLILKYPKFGSFIVGTGGGGYTEFSSTVRSVQLSTETFPGSGEMQRELLSPYERVVDMRVREGWARYGVLMDVVQEQLRELASQVRTPAGAIGVESLTSGDVKDIMEKKKIAVEYLAEQYPLWYEEYVDNDSNKWKNKLEFFRDVVDVPRFVARGDVQQVAVYLDVRETFEKELAIRAASYGSGTLDAQQNADILSRWNEWRTEWAAGNIAAGDLFSRYFEFDLLPSDSWSEENQNLANR